MAANAQRTRMRGRFHDLPGVREMAAGCSLIVIHNVLPADELKRYMESAVHVPRTSTASAFGHMKPRREICYRTANDPIFYGYSGKKHPTVLYLPHVQRVVDILYASVAAYVPDNEFSVQSLGVDIVYDAQFTRGGSIGAHADDEMDWDLVIIFSLGQERVLRVRERSNGEYTNVPLRHNSIVAMHGADFQRLFTHQVDKLPVGAAVSERYSLNVRYLRRPPAAPVPAAAADSVISAPSSN